MFKNYVKIGWRNLKRKTVVSLMIALLMVSWPAFRATVANPVQSLRDERSAMDN